MPIVYARDVSRPVYDALKRRATQAGRSLSAEVREILQEATAPKRSLKSLLRAIETTRANHKGRFDVDAEIRRDRRR